MSDPNKDVPPTKSVLDRLACALPDIPRWLYARSMLLSGRCEVLGLAEGGPEPQFVVRELEESEARAVCVVGRPPVDAIREAARRNRNVGEVLATQEGASHILGALPDWTATRATLHLLGDASRLPRLAEGEVRPFGVSDLATVADDLPEGLRSELQLVLTKDAPAVTALADGRPVSFCYAADETDGLWDISIDTLEPYRRQGYAARCVSYMADEMRRRGKEPVWAAEVTNLPSMRLAAKLGFVPVDGLLLFRPPSEPDASREVQTTVMSMKERIFSPLPRDVSPEELVPEVNFYSRVDEFDLSFVRGLVEDHANPSLLSLTRLPTGKVAAESCFSPKDGCLPRWRVPSTTIGFSARSVL